MPETSVREAYRVIGLVNSAYLSTLFEFRVLDPFQLLGCRLQLREPVAVKRRF